MPKTSRILGLIPARGGSKGLPRKNLLPLNGKPLITWTIEQALASRHLDRVVVSTDSRGISAVAGAAGASVPFLRPKRLASDTSGVVDAVLHALDHFARSGEEFEYVALLEPTSPLRKPGEIDAAITTMLANSHRADCLISVGEIALEHPAYAKKIGDDGRIHPYVVEKSVSRTRQGLPASFFPYGVIYLSKTSHIRKTKTVYSGRILPYFIERWQNYEINDIWDFRCVEAILAARMRS